MQQYSSLPEAHSLLDATPTLMTAIGQLRAELWLERSLNSLQSRLNDCLSAVFTANNTEAEIFQTVVNELNNALNTTRVAIALENPQEKVCKVCYLCTPLHQTQILKIPILNGGRQLRLNLKEVIDTEELQHLENQQPQSAWQLLDNSGIIIGWLIIALPTLSSSSESLHSQVLIEQLMACASKICTKAITQYRHIHSLQQKCQQLDNSNQELERTNQIKNQFLASTSHEIRTPLSSIIGFTHLLLAQGYDCTKERHQEYLNIIQSSSKHLLALINDILDLSKIEANQLEVQLETVNVQSLCRNVMALVKEKAANKGLRLHFNLDPSVTSIVADSLRLKQMLLNLLFNAIKFTTTGSVGLQVNTNGLFIYFRVWDTGTGISKENQAQLFQPYFQIPSIAVSREEGTGLGLAVTQKLAELHGGCVEVESELGCGTRFTILLPLHPVGGPGGPGRICLSSPCSKSLSSLFTPQSKDILLVEDDSANALLMQTYLRKLGYQVTWVKNAASMWKVLKKLQPAVILLDINLPDSNGLTIMQQLRENNQYRTIPVIAQTAMAMKGDRESCLAAGANDYISKPIDLPLLAILVSKYSKPLQ